MQSFLSKMGKTASSAVIKAGNKAGELIEITKLKSRISSEKQAIVSAKQEIGEYCYDLFKSENMKDKNIKEYCEKIKACEDNIEQLEQEIQAAREEYKAESKEEEDTAVE